MKIYLASSNKDKLREMRQLFPNYTIVEPFEEGIAFAPEETGSTFYENSLIKAQALYNITGLPVIADDSGICVDALNGAPGIFSARYAGSQYPKGLPDGKKITQAEQNELLIEQTNKAILEGTIPKDARGRFLLGLRTCRYVCAMVLYLGPERLYVAQETMEGTLIEDIKDARGSGGFGYDPLFLVPSYKKTAAELTAEQKNAISHRGKAARAIRTITESLADFS